MKINLAKSAGFCFGVKRALKIALETAGLEKKVYMLGDIVHNEDVVKEISKAGVKKINKLSSGKNKTLLIRAHGASSATLEKARRLGYKIIDATCPKVQEIHRIVRDMEQKGYKIIIIGDKKHDEVGGIAGQLNSKAMVIEGLRDLAAKRLRVLKKACVVAQSTQNLEKVRELVTRLKQHIKELKFFNTICQPTRIKQAEIKKLPRDNDIVIIIGSKTSANTKRLYEISRSINKRSYWISSKKEIRKDWFRNAESVGITAGASTPESRIQDIIKHISSYINSLAA